MAISGTTTHGRLLCGAAAAAILVFSGAAHAQEQAPITIAPQSLATALYEFGGQTGRQVLFTPDIAATKVTRGVAGATNQQIALAELLDGTGLTFRQTGDTYLIVRADAPQSGSAAGDGAEVEALIVTAQKREENIQDVPIAISAFSATALEEQKIEGGFDLLKAIPNVTFSKNNFSGYNFSIRGIGTKAISVTTDPGVAVEFNNMALIRNRLFEQEYFDVERVEVLRGPQGTLHGRNATSGVINMISAKPDLDAFEGWIKGEVGNYHAKRLSAMVNVPLVEDKLAVRVAGALTQRQGYGVNLYDDSDVDGRDLWSGRVSLGFQPTERLRADLIWERFEEDDNRARTSKQLCTRDPGPTEVGDVAIPFRSEGHYALRRSLFSQGCLPGSLYDDRAYEAPNGIAIPFVLFLEMATFPNYSSAELCQTSGGICTVIPMGLNPYGNITQSTNLREMYSKIKPTYRASADTVELNLDLDLTDALSVASQTVYVNDAYYASQDFNRYATQPAFFDTLNLPAGRLHRPLAPNGVICDPQLGCSDTIVGMDISRAKSDQFSQELRIQSDFDAPLNFSAGVHYTRYRTVEDYYVFFNALTRAAVSLNNIVILGGRLPHKVSYNPDCSATDDAFGLGYILPDGFICVPIEQNSIENIQDTGHNYFLSRNPYKLRSAAAFGEVYWQMTDTLKWTGGLRYTDDQKIFTPIPSETLLSDAARLEPWFPVQEEFGLDLSHIRALSLYSFGHGAYPAQPDIKRNWKEITGRLGFDWKPDLTFTDQTMIYGFYSRGYKGGGMNPPRIGLDYELLEENGIVLAPSAPLEFRPEFVNAYEVGAKNALLTGALMLNANAFFYDYTDYQVSKIVDRTANNENFDAKIWGLEFETLFAPSPNLRINASLGYLDTRLGKGSQSIDVMNRTAGNEDWVVVKPAVTSSSNCIVPVSVASQLLSATTITDPRGVWNACPAGGIFGESFTGNPTPFNPFGSTLPDGSTYDPADHPEANYGAGFYSDVSGNELPNSPHWTVTLGAQYSHEFKEGWKATIRADGYWQAQSWARIYELPIDKLHGWYNANLSVWVENEDGLKIELYAKNLLDKSPITDTFTNSDDTALTTNVFVLDPRLIGLSIRKEF